ncbi:hypothetical protein [Saccharopolyspora rosea]|nr:hypothetical protein [Saccharopolyspora rosea]
MTTAESRSRHVGDRRHPQPGAVPGVPGLTCNNRVGTDTRRLADDDI